MPRLRHYDHDGRARFITFSTYCRVPVLSNANFRNIVVEALRAARKQWRFKLLGYVLMPDHVHLVVWPLEEMRVGEMIGDLKKSSAERIHGKLKGSPLEARLTRIHRGTAAFRFWQLRCYDHNCRTEESVWEKVNYCHFNPVKAGLVRRPEDWEWSSYRSIMGMADVLLEVDLLLE